MGRRGLAAPTRAGWFPVVLVVGVVAFVAGWATATWDADSCDPAAPAVVRSDTYQGWAALTGLVFVAGVYGFGALLTVRERMLENLYGFEKKRGFILKTASLTK